MEVKAKRENISECVWRMQECAPFIFNFAIVSSREHSWRTCPLVNGCCTGQHSHLHFARVACPTWHSPFQLDNLPEATHTTVKVGLDLWQMNLATGLVQSLGGATVCASLWPPLEGESLCSQQMVNHLWTPLTAFSTLLGQYYANGMSETKASKGCVLQFKSCGTEDILLLNHSHAMEMLNKTII